MISLFRDVPVILKAVQSVPRVESAPGSGDKSSSTIKKTTTNSQPVSERASERQAGRGLQRARRLCARQRDTGVIAALTLWRVAHGHFSAAAGGPSEAAVTNNETTPNAWLGGLLDGPLELSHVASGGSKVSFDSASTQHRSVLTGQVAGLCGKTQRTMRVAQFPARG